MLCDNNLPVCTKTLHQVMGIDFRRYVISKCSVIVLSYLSHTVCFFMCFRSIGCLANKVWLSGERIRLPFTGLTVALILLTP